MSFVHLHTHTEYSLLDGSNKIKEYVSKVKSLGMNAAAITDHGAMYGVIDFYRECKSQNINPVIGTEIYVTSGSRFKKEAKEKGDRYYHLILLAENDIGYANLMKIVSIGFVEGFYYRPRVDYEVLNQYHEGLICLSACVAGEVPRAIVEGDYERAKSLAIKYRDIFGENNFYLEMQDHGLQVQKQVNAGLMHLSQETGIPLVITNDCHYTNASDAQAHDALICIQTGKKIADEDRMRYEGGQFFVKSEEEMREVFPYVPQAFENTQKIADRCNVNIEFGISKLPQYDLPEGEEAFQYLTKLCKKGLNKRYPDLDENTYKEINSRLNYELELIKTMGFVDYFLIVWDFINYAKENKIPVGPGRGSAAGSIVAYLTEITDTDPLKYDLLFERFLNPERVTMPDIDIDFCPERRGEVIDYVVKKYGKEQVAQIITFGTLKAKAVIRDVGRVMDLPYNFVSNIASQIPAELKMTIDKALSVNPELKKMYEDNTDVKQLIDLSKKLEGLPRHTSMHAAGVVISSQPIVNYVPLARASDDQVVTQFTMVTLEELGLLKMDFLGLRNLTVIDDCLEMIEENRGEDIDFYHMEYDDKETYALISSGKNDGVFQLESPGMSSFMTTLKPECIDDIIAGIALYRPGPMDFIPQYISGKNNRDSIKYDCKELEPILKSTYGCIVYQEQVMQIVRDIAGYSLGRSDLLRRAMSKKKHDVMTKEKEVFLYGDKDTGVPGCIANGIEEKVAIKIYEDMLDFANYAFNKSHAASYAMVSYQTAYLKCHYPHEFYAALLSTEINNIDKIKKYISSAREMGIELSPPDVNASHGNFVVKDNKIVYGMYAIKRIGKNAIDSIVKEREENGPYRDMEDFIGRIIRLRDNENKSGINKKSIEALILSGALDCLPGNRHQKMCSYAIMMERLVKDSKDIMAGQMSLIDFMGDDNAQLFKMQMPNVDEYDREELLAYEKEVMGIYVSGYPLEEYVELLQKRATATCDMFAVEASEEDEEEIISENKLNENLTYVLGGMITEVNVIYTKKGQPMAFINLEDMTGTVEVIVFPNTYVDCRAMLFEENKVFVKGRPSFDGERGVKLICEKMVEFKNLPSTLWLRLKNKDDFLEVKEEFEKLISNYEGDEPIAIHLTETNSNHQIRAKVGICKELLDDLKLLLGEDNIKTVPASI